MYSMKHRISVSTSELPTEINTVSSTRGSVGRGVRSTSNRQKNIKQSVNESVARQDATPLPDLDLSKLPTLNHRNKTLLQFICTWSRSPVANHHIVNTHNRRD